MILSHFAHGNGPALPVGSGLPKLQQVMYAPRTLCSQHGMSRTHRTMKVMGLPSCVVGRGRQTASACLRTLMLGAAQKCLCHYVCTAQTTTTTSASRLVQGQLLTAASKASRTGCHVLHIALLHPRTRPACISQQHMQHMHWVLPHTVNTREGLRVNEVDGLHNLSDTRHDAAKQCCLVQALPIWQAHRPTTADACQQQHVAQHRQRTACQAKQKTKCSRAARHMNHTIAVWTPKIQPKAHRTCADVVLHKVC